jgi:ectoine hydroxylase-related dioxygenase (phytanoyl-CoA dioxygenase family)
MHDAHSIAREVIDGNGFVVLPDLVPAAAAEALREQSLRLAEEYRADGTLIVEAGGRRERVRRVLDRDAVFLTLVQHPLLLAIAHAVIGQPPIVSAFGAHILRPGAPPMGRHVDYPYWAMTPPYPASGALTLQVIVMTHDFNERNGAPRFVAGSQLERRPPDDTFAARAEFVTGSAGSAVVSHGLSWHDTSVNESAEPRVSILVNYGPVWVQPMAPMRSLYPSAFLDGLTASQHQLLGLDVAGSLATLLRTRPPALQTDTDRV